MGHVIEEGIGYARCVRCGWKAGTASILSTISCKPAKKGSAPMSKLKYFTAEQRLQAFLYLLMRDSVTFGAVEKALQEVQRIDCGSGIRYSEPKQAAYADRLARDILKTK